MIADLDLSIEQLLQLELGTVTPPTLPFDLSFSIPDKSFTPISGTKNTLNCYLYDIREDRELRRTEPITQRLTDGTFTRKNPPVRVQLSYCLTAWSPTAVTPGTSPPQDEHQLLSDILRVLLKYPTLPSAALYGSLVGQQPPLPTTIILPDTAKSVNDFWTAIGGQLRPSLDYKVTLSLDYADLVTGPIVTMQISSYSQSDISSEPEERIQIGGQVLDSAVPPNPVPNAWVRLDTAQTEISDADGRFVFCDVIRGPHLLQVRAVGYQDATRNVQVPEPTGNYNIFVSP